MDGGVASAQAWLYGSMAGGRGLLMGAWPTVGVANRGPAPRCRCRVSCLMSWRRRGGRGEVSGNHVTRV